MFFLLYNIQLFYICFLCEDLKCITVNFIKGTQKGTVLQHFNPQSHVSVRQQKQCVINRELHTAQNPHCSSRPEPRQVAANSFTQSIPSLALNGALQTSTTTFMTYLPTIYSFTIQPLFKKMSVTSSNTKHATPRSSLYRRLNSICLRCIDCCKNKDQDANPREQIRMP